MRALLYVTALIVCSIPACWSKVIELTDIEVEYAGFFRDTILNKHYHNNKGVVCMKVIFFPHEMLIFTFLVVYEFSRLDRWIRDRHSDSQRSCTTVDPYWTAKNGSFRSYYCYNS